MSVRVLLLLFIMCLSVLTAAEPWNGGAAAARQAMLRAANGLRVVHITAHPDDEDAPLLTALSRGHGYDVLLLSLTRGEGGANLTGPEMYDSLGRIRTEETLAAARHYGVRLRFASAKDFGFSKRLDETFEHWDKQALVREVVEILREEQPHIVIARFHGTARDGHGNHQAAGVIAAEAFRALPQAAKLFVSTRAGEPSTHSVNTAEYDPLTAMTWRELATMGYRQHRTQGMGGIAAFRGGPASTLRLVESRVKDDGKDLASGVSREGSEEARKLVLQALQTFDATQPWKSAQALAQVLRQASAPLHRKRIEDAIAAALCLRLSGLLSAGSQPVPGSRMDVRIEEAHEGDADVTTAIDAPAGWAVEGKTIKVPQNASIGPVAVQVRATVRTAGVEFSLARGVELQRVHPVNGPHRSALEVVAPVELSVWPEVALLPAGATSHKVRVTARANTAASGHIFVGEQRVPFGFSGAGEEFTREFEVNAGTASELQISAKTETYIATANQRVIRSDVRIPRGLRVGYIQGAGDETASMLRHAGVAVTNLSAEDLAAGDLSQFHSILVGVRASAVRPDFLAHRKRLLGYAEGGGNVVVQYQTEEFDGADYGPFPYKLTARSEEVSEERAPVRILNPEHPVFQHPNKIDARAFDGWIEQRGSKWMTEWDSRYEALLESHDREQPPQRGGLLFARTGKGTWTYAAYAFYRQLPAGVPGAWKILVNLLSTGVI